MRKSKIACSRIGRQPNAIKYYCAREISQLSSTGDADGAPISSIVPMANGRGAFNSNRPRTSSLSSSEGGDKVRSPAPIGRNPTSSNNSTGSALITTTAKPAASWPSVDRTVQPAESSTDRGCSSGLSAMTNNSLTSNGQLFMSLSDSCRTNNSKNNSGANNNNNNNSNNNQANMFSNMRRFSCEPVLGTHGKSALTPAMKKRKSVGNLQQQHSIDSTASDGPDVYDRGLRPGVITLDALPRAPVLEYSLPNPDMSSHISSTTNSLHEIRSPGVEPDDEIDISQGTNDKMLNPLAVHLPLDENSEDLVTSYCKSFNTGPTAIVVLPRREPSSTFAYSPTIGKDSTAGLYPFPNRSAFPDQSSPSRLSLVPSVTDSGSQSTGQLPLPEDDDDNEDSQAQGVDSTNARSTRSIVDHLTSTVLQFRQQHQQRLGSLARTDISTGSIKHSASSPPPLETEPNASRLPPHNRRLTELPSGSLSDENESAYPAPSDSPSQPVLPTRAPISSSYHAYSFPSSCKPASPEFAWHNQSSQPQTHTHSHPKQRYAKSNGSPSSTFDSTQHFRVPGAPHTPKYCDLSPRSINGNSEHSPAVTAALCAAAAAEVTSTSSSSAPWFAAAAAAAAMANALMVASQAPSSSSNTPGLFADAYAIHTSGNGCQTEITGCRRGALPSTISFPKRLKVSSSDSPLTVNSSGPPICSVSPHQLEQYVGSLGKCDASTVLRSFHLPNQGIDVQANSRLTHPSTVAAMRAAAAAAAAAAATAAGLVLSNSGVRPLPDELAQMHRTTAAAAAALTTLPDVSHSYENSTASSSPSPPPVAQPSTQQLPPHIFGRIPCTLTDAPVMYGSLEPRSTANLSIPRKDPEPVGRTKNGPGAVSLNSFIAKY
ncbi:unnamed protein product [Echinostoma caproni]|uniref:C2H2-type domain-containing protein n=1 Tax=Echinostoma caproni TaxID=27848 RepID=A0A183AW00_9TREM|nr:unnamed protein product [Echinostoma caproni]